MAKTTCRALETTWALSTALFLYGCAGDVQHTDADPSARLAIPPRKDFELVADAMQLHCGTLDCHGQVGRNMRLYGLYGLRLSAMDNPLQQSTTAAEYEASYRSIVGLEPEAMSQVVRRQATPQALSMIRKARGVEKHKGGQLVVEGDPLDRCMTSWLAGPFDVNTCNAVAQTPRPQADGGP
jgi:hypothetical protein